MKLYDIPMGKIVFVYNIIKIDNLIEKKHVIYNNIKYKKRGKLLQIWKGVLILNNIFYLYCGLNMG